MMLIKSDIVSLCGAAISMQGGRPENQDDMVFLDTPLGFLAVICDGMGGGPGGKTASYIAKYEIANTLCECTPQTPRGHALKMAVSRANEALEKKMNEVPSLQGMGSTFVAVLINKDSAFVAHAGDSRCYVLRGSKCVYRTQDHSLVGELVRKKALTEEEARLSPQSNVISRGLGSTTNHVPEIEEIPYKKGDRIVLCTDGVWGIMPHKELLKRFTPKNNSQQIVADISSEIDNIGFSNGGKHDNHTIAVLDLEISSSLKPKVGLKIIALICSAICIMIAISGVALFFLLHNKTENLSIGSGETTSNSTYNFNSGMGLSSNPSTVEENKVGDSARKDSTPKVDFSNTDTLRKHLNAVIKQKGVNSMSHKKDSASNKAKEVDNPAETTQKVINRYNSAKAVEGTTAKETQEKLDILRKEIKTLMSQLHKQCEKNNNVLATVDAIDRMVDVPSSWYANRTKDDTTGKFKPTPNALKLMNKQIEKLTTLKSKL